MNLDPQLAVSSEDVTAVMHLFRGLMRLDASGEPQPDAAESWTVSEDGKVYTFTLKEDLEWVWYRQRNQDYLRAVTAEDYVYGFQRVFDPETGSPYADDFSCIAGSEAVREGRADPSTLGVEAVDERTVRITLETADPEFLTKLCLPGAMPCNREFFDSTEGSYGLSSSSVMGNGPFYLYNWTSEGLFLRRSTSGSAINNLRLVLRDPEDTASPADRVRDGSSGAELSDTAAEDLAQIAYTSRTWGLLFNCSSEDNPLANVSVRQALASAATGADLTLPSGCEPAQGLIPPSVNYAGESYRTAVGSALFTASDPVALYQQGMAELGQTTSASWPRRAATTPSWWGQSTPAGSSCLPASSRCGSCRRRNTRPRWPAAIIRLRWPRWSPPPRRCWICPPALTGNWPASPTAACTPCSPLCRPSRNG